MTPFFLENLNSATLKNDNFRQVLFTTQGGQLVLMSLLPMEEIGAEVHEHVDQYFWFVSGRGKAVIDGKEYFFKAGSSLIVPRGSNHNIINDSNAEALKLYTVYTPANHPDGTIHKTKADAEAYEKAKQAK